MNNSQITFISRDSRRLPKGKFGACEPLLLKIPVQWGIGAKAKCMMVQQFTWQQFLVAAMVFTLLWYVAVALIFYRNEIKSLLSGGITGPLKSEDEPLPHRWGKDVQQVGSMEDELIGATKLPDGMTSVSMAGIGFVQGDQARADQVGLVPDVLAEIREVFGVLEKQDGSKRDFFNLMEMVREKFPSISSNPNIPQINSFISESAPFHLSAEELENLWD